ncbi:MAG TPA: glycosyltransferase, partial [Gemmatimonadales bacterium]|nr:glycosyltransferase [Gemmatimonadales bacterium]
MTATPTGSILMLSTHGYVAAEPELGLPDTGGQVVFVLELAKQLAEMGYRVDIVTRRFEDQPEFDDMGPGLRVWRIPFGGSDFIRKEDMHEHLDDFQQNFVAAAAEAQISYDVVNSHYWDGGWAGQHLAEEWEIPHIHTPHSLGSWKRAGMQGDPQELEGNYRFEERIRKEFLVYRRADHVIATTTQQVELLQESYGVPERHVAMIPPGIDERRYTPVDNRTTQSIRRRFGFRKHDVYTVGRAAANKGYDLLIRALPALRDSVPDARLRLAVGANSDKDRRMVSKWQGIAASEGVAEQVQWLGYVSDEAMADHYRAAPVFALPSRYEPFGMTAVEAMACGTPCVVTVHGGLEEVFDFGSQALFADPKRPAEFATMLSMPLRYPRLR